MKTAITLAVTIATLTGIPLLAQDSGADANANSSANDPAKVTYAPAAGGFGDLAASHAYEMNLVTGELEGKLDSKTAKVGDRIVLKTAEKVQTSDGTVIPKGSRLVGHIIEAQAYDTDHGPARIAIAFDHAELKNGQSIAIYSLIRGVNPSASALAASSRSDDGMIGMPMSGGERVDVGDGPAYGRGGGMTNGTGGLRGGAVDRTTDGASSASDRANRNPGSAVNTGAGESGDLSVDAGAHGVAAARARPRPTGIPGVMLAGNSSSSGVLLCSLKNIQFEDGTQIELGVVAER
jgi:hypothetical protein